MGNNKFITIVSIIVVVIVVLWTVLSICANWRTSKNIPSNMDDDYIEADMARFQEELHTNSEVQAHEDELKFKTIYYRGCCIFKPTRIYEGQEDATARNCLCCCNCTSAGLYQ